MCSLWFTSFLIVVLLLIDLTLRNVFPFCCFEKVF
jgi:hypothetical protein